MAKMVSKCCNADILMKSGDADADAVSYCSKCGRNLDLDYNAISDTTPNGANIARDKLQTDPYKDLSGMANEAMRSRVYGDWGSKASDIDIMFNRFRIALQQKALLDRINDVNLIVSYLTESDKVVVSSSFIEGIKRHAEKLQEKLAKVDNDQNIQSF